MFYPYTEPCRGEDYVGSFSVEYISILKSTYYSLPDKDQPAPGDVYATVNFEMEKKTTIITTTG